MVILDWFDRLKMTPAKIIALGFFITIMTGAVLLNLPIATQSGESIGFVNALFMATSCVCVTGLTLVDPGTYFNLFGQLTMLGLIQIGGLGIMAVATLIAVSVGAKFSLRSRILLSESLGSDGLAGVVRLTKKVIFITFFIEALGALVLSTQFIPAYGTEKGIYYSIFHAVSAFCNAGFDVLGYGNNLVNYSGNVVVNFAIMSLIVLGGIGFFVIMEVVSKRSFKKFSLHTKLVLVVTALLIFTGFALITLIEWDNPGTMAGKPIYEKMLMGLFASITARTAGFATMDYSQIKDASAFITCVLMFFGGSPGSCAGGVKTTTLAIIALTIFSIVDGKKDVDVYKRTISQDAINKAMSVMGIGLGICVFVVTLLSISEPDAKFIAIMLETFSAFGTVGLSMNFSPLLSVFGKLVITSTMFMGRLGTLTVAFAIAQKQKNATGNIKYPVDKVMVG